MIQMQTVLESADNTGAKKLLCIKVLGGSKRRYAGIGDVIKVSVREAAPRGRVKKARFMTRSWCGRCTASAVRTARACAFRKTRRCCSTTARSRWGRGCLGRSPANCAATSL